MDGQLGQVSDSPILGPDPRHHLVALGVTVGVGSGQLGLAHTTEAGDGLGNDGLVTPAQGEFQASQLRVTAGEAGHHPGQAKSNGPRWALRHIPPGGGPRRAVVDLLVECQISPDPDLR